MTPKPPRADRPSPADDFPRGHGERAPRVLLKPVAPRTGYVDGVWWPYTDNLPAELPGLITGLAARLHPVLRVAYHLVEWATPPGELVVAGRAVRLDWHHAIAHTVMLLGSGNRRLVLLVVPSGTDPGDAYTAMTTAAAANNAARPEDLLQIGIRKRRERKRRAAAVRRWAARTTSSN
ncbi:DUF5994 family protein [Nocardia otitidiscaviarum]|uniref:DUF5994 family protein n=1 Tax=Nocardia otitidiscaviarum TaxID=1823 RepID=UPI002457E075|nr:DUF5994 family protein [Nocardia otitidiscaviarum]